MPTKIVVCHACVASCWGIANGWQRLAIVIPEFPSFRSSQFVKPLSLVKSLAIHIIQSRNS
jgi:hypothetical protein